VSNENNNPTYETLSPSDRTLFTEVCRRLFSDGFLWRDDSTDRTLYHFVRRQTTLIEHYFDIMGWQLTLDERLGIVHISHREGAHRYRFNRDTTIWLLLFRLLYAEQRESLSLFLGRNPTVDVGTAYTRYLELGRNPAARKKSSYETALRTLSHYKLIRAVEGGTLRVTNNDQLIELLPILEIIIPTTAIATLTEQLNSYGRTDDEGTNEDADVESNQNLSA
jgi:hypothetical protein